MITPDLVAEMAQNTDSDSHPATALTILNIMKEIGVDKAIFTYSGSGDSPDSCDGTFFMLKGIVVTKDVNGNDTAVEDWEELGTNDPKRILIQAYHEAMSEFVFNLSYDHWGGWYNNEGGYGTGTFMARDDKTAVTVDHYSYVQSEVFEGEYEYNAAGQHESEPAYDDNHEK